MNKSEAAEEDVGDTTAGFKSALQRTKYLIVTLFIMAAFRFVMALIWLLLFTSAMILKSKSDEDDSSYRLFFGMVLQIWDVALSVTMVSITAYNQILLSRVVSWLNVISSIAHSFFIGAILYNNWNQIRPLHINAMGCSAAAIITSILVLVIVLKLMPNIYFEQHLYEARAI